MGDKQPKQQQQRESRRWAKEMYDDEEASRSPSLYDAAAESFDEKTTYQDPFSPSAAAAAQRARDRVTGRAVSNFSRPTWPARTVSVSRMRTNCLPGLDVGPMGSSETFEALYGDAQYPYNQALVLTPSVYEGEWASPVSARFVV